jgi:hypothetical protein
VCRRPSERHLQIVQARVGRLGGVALGSPLLNSGAKHCKPKLLKARAPGPLMLPRSTGAGQEVHEGARRRAVFQLLAESWAGGRWRSVGRAWTASDTQVRIGIAKSTFFSAAPWACLGLFRALATFNSANYNRCRAWVLSAAFP